MHPWAIKIWSFQIDELFNWIICLQGIINFAITGVQTNRLHTTRHDFYVRDGFRKDITQGIFKFNAVFELEPHRQVSSRAELVVTFKIRIL